MSKILKFEIDDANIIEEDTDSQFAIAKINAFSSSKNRHNMVCSEDVLRRTAPTIYNKPILYSYDKYLDDFKSHTDPEKSLIAGFVEPGSVQFERLEDSRLSMSVTARIWKKYVPKFVEIFKRDGRKKVSVEMDLYDSKKREEDGLIEMLDYVYNGICFLADSITEASPGASGTMLSFAKENTEYKEAYEKEFGDRYDSLDLSIPSTVKKNVAMGLDLSKEHRKGSTSISLATANHLMKNEVVSMEKIRHIAKIFKSARFNNMQKSPPSSEYITFLLYGGTEGKKWAEKICFKLADIDESHLSYFGQVVTFPYDSLKDANPAIMGIDPPVSLSQANAIAAQADAIGVDEKKHGWAIAISSFKKTHVVKDDKWVKKEANMSDELFITEVESMCKKIGLDESDKEVKKNMEKEFELEEEKDKKFEEETPEEEKEEEKQEEKEEKKEEMSLDVNLDVAAILAMLADETEAYKELTADFSDDGEKNFSKLCSAMYAKMCKMAKDFEEKEKTWMSEAEQLKSFKLGVEQKEYNFQVNSLLKEIEDTVDMPKDNVEALREKSKEFGIENVDAWKNLAKSHAFEFSKKKEFKEDTTVRVGLPWVRADVAITSSPWRR